MAGYFFAGNQKMSSGNCNFARAAILIVLLWVAGATRNQTIVISDVHMGSSWFSETEKIQAFKLFLIGLTDPNTRCKRLVVNGDIIETWLYSFYETPLHYVEIMQSEELYGANVKEIMDIFKKIAANNIEIVYTKGNHDIEMEPEDFAQIGLNVTYAGDVYVLNNVRIEHGHRYDFFNSPDPAGVRPFGYYVSRAGSTLTRQSASYSSNVNFVCKEILASDFVVSSFRDNFGLILQRVVEGALSNTILSIVGLSKYNAFKNVQLRDGCVWGYDSGDITLGLAVQKYLNVIDRYMSLYNTQYVQNMLECSCGDFDKFITGMISDLVVMGHTHKYRSARFNRVSGGDIVYMNAGGWTNDVKKLTFVVIEFDELEIGKMAELREWHYNGTSTVLSTEYFGEAATPKYVPPEWKCNTKLYQDGAQCDCNCGAYDPDCDYYTSRLIGCVQGVATLDVTCSKTDGACTYTSRVPTSWTCPADQYFQQSQCRCECGTYDPSCSFYNTSSIIGCNANPIGCSVDGSCIYADSTAAYPPLSWTCPLSYYGSEDGCDCGCGAIDKDCASTQTTSCNCIGTFKDSGVINFEIGFWILLAFSILFLCTTIIFGGVLFSILARMVVRRVLRSRKAKKSKEKTEVEMQANSAKKPVEPVTEEATVEARV